MMKDKPKLKGKVHPKNNWICISKFSYQHSRSDVLFYVSFLSNPLFLFKVEIFGHLAYFMKDAVFMLLEGQPRFESLHDDV